jgi:hypothetical protein
MVEDDVSAKNPATAELWVPTFHKHLNPLVRIGRLDSDYCHSGFVVPPERSVGGIRAGQVLDGTSCATTGSHRSVGARQFSRSCSHNSTRTNRSSSSGSSSTAIASAGTEARSRRPHKVTSMWDPGSRIQRPVSPPLAIAWSASRRSSQSHWARGHRRPTHRARQRFSVQPCIRWGGIAGMGPRGSRGRIDAAIRCDWFCHPWGDRSGRAQCVGRAELGRSPRRHSHHHIRRGLSWHRVAG